MQPVLCRCLLSCDRWKRWSSPEKLVNILYTIFLLCLNKLCKNSPGSHSEARSPKTGSISAHLSRWDREHGGNRKTALFVNQNKLPAWFQEQDERNRTTMTFQMRFGQTLYCTKLPFHFVRCLTGRKRNIRLSKYYYLLLEWFNKSSTEFNLLGCRMLNIGLTPDAYFPDLRSKVDCW